jgi:hypothetical protein
VPVKWEFADGIIVLRMIDVYAADDIKNTLLEALADPAVSNAVGLLFDVSQSKSLSERSRGDLVAMGYFLAQRASAFGKRVALVASDDFQFGMMRMGRVTLEREDLTAEVFREEADAREWLLNID